MDSEQEMQRALDWLTDQGGLAEMNRASRDFYDSTWYALEKEGLIERVVPDGCSRMYWSIL